MRQYSYCFSLSQIVCLPPHLMIMYPQMIGFKSYISDVVAVAAAIAIAGTDAIVVVTCWVLRGQ